MKKKKVFKKVVICTLSVAIFLLFFLGITLFVNRNTYKENGDILSVEEGFKNINPKFTVKFLNSGDVRFESSKSYRNPFEDTEGNIWEKVKYNLGIDREKMGIELRLEDISYDDSMSEVSKVELEYSELEKHFDLVQSGRDIYGESEVLKDSIVSKGVYKGVDIQYQIVDGKGLKEEIVLQNRMEYSIECELGECVLPVNRYVFRITLDDGLELRRSITGTKDFPAGTQYFTDKEGNYFAHFLPEFAKDAVGNKTSKVYVNISSTQKKNEYIYELILDSQWLLSEERVFPVYIDPSIVHDSDLSFNLGTYEKTVYNEIGSITLDKQYLSGQYTSGIISLGGNAILDNIVWTALGVGTQSAEIPYSRLGLLLEENFNNLESEKVRYGSGALTLSQSGEVKTFSVNPSSSSYSALEFWIYQREGGGENIFKSNLGNLSIKEGKYSFEDHITGYPVEYDVWRHVSVVFDLINSKAYVYIDGQVEEVSLVSGNGDTLRYISVGGANSFYGYMDILRIYDRLLTKYEVASNTQYSNVFLTYRISGDGTVWSDWLYNASFTPKYEQRDGDIYIDTESRDVGEYDVFSFLYAAQKEGKLNISKEYEYTLKPVFNATLNTAFLDINSKEVYLRERGVTSNYIQNLNIGDVVIVKEVINSVEYVIEGEVLSVDKGTGLIKVVQWSGNIPEQGFTVGASVFKWQREYIPVDISFNNIFHLEGIDSESIKDIQLLSGFKGGTAQLDVETGYIQYRYIFISQRFYLTPYLSNVNINYSNAGPLMEQVMRHGKWFNEEGSQSFWWVK